MALHTDITWDWPWKSLGQLVLTSTISTSVNFENQYKFFEMLNKIYHFHWESNRGLRIQRSE